MNENKKKDDWIEKFNKETVGYVFTVAVSVVTAMITTLAITQLLSR